MKLLVCLTCGDWFAPGKKTVRNCECGGTAAKWIDPKLGTLDVYCYDGPKGCRVVGIINDMLVQSISRPDMGHDEWREFTEKLVESVPGYLFDKTLRGCPVVFMKPGDSSDVQFHYKLGEL